MNLFSLPSLMRRGLAVCLLLYAIAGAAQNITGAQSNSARALAQQEMATVANYIEENAEKTGVYVLETGDEALRARAWLVEHAQQSIEVQYFIWSTDNIGILAGEALLRAANRGVRVRVIVDDLLIDAAARTMLALNKHPNIEVQIYNPKHSVNVPWYKRILFLFSDFRGSNQRMHDKTFIVDGKIAITGGRNMAAEYFDYNHKYNFRDRDALIMGKVVQDMTASFSRFWQHNLSVPVNELYDGKGFLESRVTINDEQTKQHYAHLHAYAASPENFEPAVRKAIAGTTNEFERLSKQVIWSDARFISDTPGKNDKTGLQLSGGGQSTRALAELLTQAKEEVIIQSPYLVLSDAALRLFSQTVKRGVKVRINTNSLAATDNIQAFSGYRNQRESLLSLGLEIYEFRPDAVVQRGLMQRASTNMQEGPIFSLHAKTMVIDQRTVYIGTYNLDPRSENLNTEVGIIVSNPALAAQVRTAIATDMSVGNSWNAATDNPDQYVSWFKRVETWFWQMLPLRAIL